MALHQASRRNINELHAKIGEIEPISRPITARGGKHGLGLVVLLRNGMLAWLTACAENGGKPPHDLSPWLPWSMGEERRLELAAPE